MTDRAKTFFNLSIDQFRYIKIQPQTIDLITRLWGINTEFVRFIPLSLALKFEIFGRMGSAQELELFLVIRDLEVLNF